jgi:hypothetical protein
MAERGCASMMDLPEAPELEAVLEPDPDEIPVRGGEIREDRSAPLRRRLMISGPVHARIGTKDVADDPELVRFITSQGRHYSFHALRLSCSFRPADDEPFTGCWVGIELSRADNAVGESPIAWSMEPHSLEQLMDVPAAFKFSAELKLPFVSLGGSMARKSGAGRTTAFLQAYGELGAEPSWEFNRIGRAELRGMQQLKLVVRTPAGIPVAGKTTIEANVERRRLGVMKYRATVAGDPPATNFRLG